jgi:hypothetical protein
MEELDAAAVAGGRRWMVATVLVLLLLVIGVVLIRPRPGPTRMCTADGLVGPNGTIYGRDFRQGCKFVDERGRVLPGQHP